MFSRNIYYELSWNKYKKVYQVGRKMMKNDEEPIKDLESELFTSCFLFRTFLPAFEKKVALCKAHLLRL